MAVPTYHDLTGCDTPLKWRGRPLRWPNGWFRLGPDTNPTHLDRLDDWDTFTDLAAFLPFDNYGLQKVITLPEAIVAIIGLRHPDGVGGWNILVARAWARWLRGVPQQDRVMLLEAYALGGWQAAHVLFRGLDRPQLLPWPG